MKTSMFRGVLLLLCASFFVSCLNESVATDDGLVCVPVKCSVDGSGTKSSFSTGESFLGDWFVMAYDSNGQLCSTLFSEDGTGLLLIRDKEYHVYAVGNLGRIQAPLTEKELLDFRFASESSYDFSNGFPMSGMVEGQVKVTDGGTSLFILLERAVSRYDLLVDSSELVFSQLELTSVEVKQSAMDVSLFSQGSVPVNVGISDKASKTDLTTLNSGGSISFYLLENCGGCLLEGNRDQWKKVPDYLGSEKDKLTYLELKGRWKSSGVSSDICLRMYLGRDNCSDFNIDRNTVNLVQLTLSDQGLLQSDWRIFRYNIDDDRTLEFERKTVELVSGDASRRIRILKSPSDVRFSVSANEADLRNASISYSYDSSGITLSSSYQGSGNPEVVFYLKTWDGVVKGRMNVTVRKPSTYEIGGVDNTYLIPQNSIKWPDVVFSQGIGSGVKIRFSSSNESVAKCVWDSDDDENPLGFKAMSPGYARLSIVYGPATKIVDIYVIPDYTFSGLPDKYFVQDKGETVDYSFCATPYTVIPGKFDVGIKEGGSVLSIESCSMSMVHNFSSNGVVFGDFYDSMSFSLYGRDSGRALLTFSTDYPSRTRTMYAYVIGSGKQCNVRIAPVDGTAPISYSSSDAAISHTLDNNVGCNVQISGNDVITSVRFDRAESTKYHSDMTLSERCVVQLCGRSYSVGQTISDLDDLNSGEAFYVKGYDSIIELAITVGHSMTPVTLKLYFLNE